MEISRAHRLWVIASITMGASLASTSAAMSAEVTISNVRVGPVCGEPHNRRICFNSSEIFLTNEGQCVFNSMPRACTWYGYSFDYTAPVEGATLECRYTQLLPGNEGNPTAERQKNTRSGEYELKLKGGSHHFFNPQYTTLPPNLPAGLVDEMKQSCSYKGEVVLEVAFKLRFPD